MKTENLKYMINGWFIWKFDLSLLRANDIEVAIKYYKKGKSEGRHFHMIATEFTAIISLKVRMNDKTYFTGDIVVIAPNESTDS